MKTLAELIGPNIEVNKFLLKKCNLKNYIIPFSPRSIYGFSHTLCMELGLSLCYPSIENKFAIYFNERTKRFIYPNFGVYHINSTEEECLQILIKTWGLKHIEEIKMELL